MKVFDHSTNVTTTQQDLEIALRCKFKQLNDAEVHHNCKLKAAFIFGVTYAPLSSWGRVLKKFLEEFESRKPGIIEALVRNGTLYTFKSTSQKRVPIIANSFSVQELKQPSRIGNTDLYYDTFTTGKDALNIIRKIVEITGTQDCLAVYIRY